MPAEAAPGLSARSARGALEGVLEARARGGRWAPSSPVSRDWFEMLPDPATQSQPQPAQPAAPSGASSGPPFRCSTCGKMYRHQPSLWKHRRYECGQVPRFACPLCPHRAKRKHHLVYHLQARHGGKPR